MQARWAHLAIVGLVPAVVYVLVLVLHRSLPGRIVDGYVRDEAGRPLRYRLNGLLVFFTTIGLWFAAGSAHFMPWDLFYVERWTMLIGACVLGLVFSALIVFGAKGTGRGALADFYLGRRPNPQARGVDAKMYLYLVGATLLALNLLSFAAYHLQRYRGEASPGVILHVALFGWFLVEYLFFEEVHLYTYDFFAERVGFKLGWGCLVFYPYFYAVGLWGTADRPDPRAPTWLYLLATITFFGGWVLSRGANFQKFLFKTRPGRKLLGVVPQEAIEEGEQRLLVSGFWGLSRHINYLGEILMAVGLTLALGWPTALAPWLYPLYYVALLLPRQLDDDRRCAAKYGPLWLRYCERVPRRIIPGLY